MKHSRRDFIKAMSVLSSCGVAGLGYANAAAEAEEMPRPNILYTPPHPVEEGERR